MKTIPKPVVLAGCMLTLFLVSSCCHMLDSCDEDNGRYAANEDFDYTINLEDQSGLAFAGVNGSITINGWDDSDHARVEGTKIVRSHSVQDAEDHLDNLQVIITEGEDELSVVTSQPAQSHGRDYTVDYVISIPKTWAIAMAHVNGNVWIEDIRDNIALTLTNGETVVDDHRGSLDVGITNGSLLCQSELPADGVWAVTLVNGSIEFEIPESTNAEFSAVVTNGSVEVDGLTLQNISQTNKTVTGTLGNGDGEIALTVVNGQIEVTGIDD